MDFPRFTDGAGARKEGLPGLIASDVRSTGLLARLIGEGNPCRTITRIGPTFRRLVPSECTSHHASEESGKDESLP